MIRKALFYDASEIKMFPKSFGSVPMINSNRRSDPFYPRIWSV